jgi:hypothetical protein
MLFGKPHETSVTLYSYEVVEEETSENTTVGASDTGTTSGRHCAWCGDPGDEYGSHTICPKHEAQMLAAAAERRRSRGRA